MSTLPPAFYGWYKSNYPTLTFNPEWLQACIEYLVSQPGPHPSPEDEPKKTTSLLSSNNSVPTSKLIKLVEEQLLSSDLSTSVSQTSPILESNSVRFSTVVRANAPRREKVLYSSSSGGNTTTTTASMNPTRGGTNRVLFQVEKVEEIATSASSQLEVVKEKKEWNKLKAKGIEGGTGARDMRLDHDDEEGTGRGMTLEEEEKKILAGGLGGDKEPRFPRGSCKFVLSDGKNLVNAFELERINGLGLEEIKLGTKLLVHDVPFVNGIMLLTPSNTIVKGHDVEELHQFKEWDVENSLRQRLNIELLPKPDTVGPLEPRSHPPPPVPSPTPVETSKPVLQDADPVRHRVRDVPMTIHTQAGSSHPTRNRPPPPSQSQLKPSVPPPLTGTKRNDGKDEFDDDLEGIDFDELQAQALRKTQKSQSRSKVNSVPTAISSVVQMQGSRTGRGRAIAQIDNVEDFDFHDVEVEEDEEDDHEGWSVLNEIEQRQQCRRPQQSVEGSRGKGVKCEPKSSGETMKTIRQGGQGPIEVLELDSDENDDDDVRPTKRLNAEKVGSLMVLELEDSD